MPGPWTPSGEPGEVWLPERGTSGAEGEMLQGPEELSSDWGPGFGVLLVCLLTALELLIYMNPGAGRFRPLLSDTGNFFFFIFAVLTCRNREVFSPQN